jgi:hypothetical protein
LDHSSLGPKPSQTTLPSSKPKPSYDSVEPTAGPSELDVEQFIDSSITPLIEQTYTDQDQALTTVRLAVVRFFMSRD